MKNKRQEAILRLIENQPIDRQETLQARLAEQGIQVTQATISRDIRQLGLVKVADGSGGYRYMAQGAARSEHSSTRFETIFRESVLKVDYAGNMVLVRCYSGMASAACELFDAMSWEDVVGTLSGDDTFFVLMRSEAAAKAITDHLQTYVAAH